MNPINNRQRFLHGQSGPWMPIPAAVSRQTAMILPLLVAPREVREAARSLGLQLHILNASSESDFDAAFAALTQLGAGALLVAADSFFYSRRDQLVALAARHAIPAIYEWREFSEAGGLASYGTDLADAYRQVGMYTGRTLKVRNRLTFP
jgi:ABC-type uncharacterized transport system substrate-binding protein